MKRYVFALIMVYFIFISFLTIMQFQGYENSIGAILSYEVTYIFKTIMILYFTTHILKTSKKKILVLLLLWFTYIAVNFYRFPPDMIMELSIIAFFITTGFFIFSPFIALTDNFEKDIFTKTILVSLVGCTLIVGSVYIQYGETHKIVKSFIIDFPIWYFIVFHITKSFKKELPILLLVASIIFIVGIFTNIGVYSIPIVYLSILITMLVVKNIRNENIKNPLVLG